MLSSPRSPFPPNKHACCLGTSLSLDSGRVCMCACVCDVSWASVCDFFSVSVSGTEESAALKQVTLRTHTRPRRLRNWRNNIHSMFTIFTTSHVEQAAIHRVYSIYRPPLTRTTSKPSWKPGCQPSHMAFRQPHLQGRADHCPRSHCTRPLTDDRGRVWHMGNTIWLADGFVAAWKVTFK